MFPFLCIVFSVLDLLLGVQGYDDRLVTIDYTYSPDELGRTVMLQCCTNGIAANRGEVPDYLWERYLGEPAVADNAIGLNSHTLFLPNFTSSQIGLYRCTISSASTVRHSAYIGVGSTEVAIAPGTISYNSVRYATPHLDCVESNYAPFSSFNYIFYRHHASMPQQAYIDKRSLFVPGFNEDDVGIYSCVVFNAAGISYGEPYEWWLDPPANPPPDPTITLNAATEELKTGTILALTCCSDGIPPPEYMWNKRNMITYALEPLHNAVGVFSDTLYVPITGVSDSGVYICTAFNSAGTSFTELLVDLSPQGPPYFLTVSPSPVYISQHQRRLIDCVAAGDPYPTLTWERVNGTLPPYTSWNYEGLTLTAFEGNDVSGVYVCTATNVNGAVERVFEVMYTSSITEVPTTAPTTLTTQSHEPPGNVTVTGVSAVVEGGTLILNCSAEGAPELTYQWLRHDSPLPEKVADSGASPLLVVPGMTWEDVGVYYCLAINPGGASYSPPVYVLLQAEDGAVISFTKSEESVDAELLGGVFGGLVSGLVLLSLTATALACYLSRPVEPALKTAPRVWDVLMGQHKNKNMFDLIVKGEPALSREPSLISLSSLARRVLRVTSRHQRPFDDDDQIDEEFDNHQRELDCEGVRWGEVSSGDVREEARSLSGEGVESWEREVEGEGDEGVLKFNNSVVVEVTIEEGDLV